MRLRSALMLVPIAALTLSCGGGDAESADTAAPSSTETQSATSTTSVTRAAQHELSPRGNYIAEIGKPIGAGNLRTSEPAVKWTITEIAVDPQCELSISKPSEDGHIILASIEAETQPGFEEDVTLPGGFHPGNNWSIADSDGYVQTRPTSEASLFCIDAEWPDEMVPASKYRFRVAFESATPSGVLQYRPPNWNNGWEWQFG